MEDIVGCPQGRTKLVLDLYGEIAWECHLCIGRLGPCAVAALEALKVALNRLEKEQEMGNRATRRALAKLWRR